jgi:type III restriction enzyme
MRKRANIKHHFMPQCYLRNFSNSENGIHTYDKIISKPYYAAIDNCCEIDDFYRLSKDYIKEITDGSAEKSVERRFAEELDIADEVCVYAKLPKGFAIPTPVGNYSPDWAIVFNENSVKHIYFIAETKGTMESLQMRPIEQAKIQCAKKLFNEISTSKVKYHDVDCYQSLLDIMKSI